MTQEITNEELARMIKEGFDDVNERMATKEDLKAFATKEDLKAFATKEDLGKFRSDMIDHIAKQSMELRGDIVVLMRGEDRKLVTLVEILVEQNILSKSDALRVTRLEPFPQNF